MTLNDMEFLLQKEIEKIAAELPGDRGNPNACFRVVELNARQKAMEDCLAWTRRINVSERHLEPRASC